jgi:ABC-type transporter MlaC component
MVNDCLPRIWFLSSLAFLLIQASAGKAEPKQAKPVPTTALPAAELTLIEEPVPCATNAAVVERSLERVFTRLRSSQVTSLPGPAGTAIRIRNAAEIARGHLDVEHFAQEVFRSLWVELDEPRQEAWKNTLQSLLQHRYVERIRDPRRHLLEILSTDVKCRLAKSRVVLKNTDAKSQSILEFHFRLSRKGWRVFDVVLEGASLVNSWRSRLSRVYREEGHDGLDRQLHRLMRRHSIEF